MFIYLFILSNMLMYCIHAQRASSSMITSSSLLWLTSRMSTSEKAKDVSAIVELILRPQGCETKYQRNECQKLFSFILPKALYI